MKVPSSVMIAACLLLAFQAPTASALTLKGGAKACVAACDAELAVCMASATNQSAKKACEDAANACKARCQTRLVE